MEEEELVCALCFPPKMGVAASETVSAPQTPKQQPQEQSQTVSLYSGAIRILPSALCLHSGLCLPRAS